MNRDNLINMARIGALTLGLAVTATTTTALALDPLPQDDHLALANFYINHIDINQPTDNSYGGTYGTNDPPYLQLQPDNHTHSRSRCGSFLALLLKGAYPELDEGDPSGDVLYHMVGSTSPTAKLWNDAIEAEATYDEPNDGANNPYGLEHINQVTDIAPGDILAAEYTGASSGSSGDATGHAMLVQGIHPQASTEPGGPIVAGTTQYLVWVIDSSSGTHSNDTRSIYGNTGLGRGKLVLYRSNTDGTIAGWTWSVGASTTVYTTDRPIVAGRLHGPAPGLTPMP